MTLESETRYCGIREQDILDGNVSCVDDGVRGVTGNSQDEGIHETRDLVASMAARKEQSEKKMGKLVLSAKIGLSSRS